MRRALGSSLLLLALTSSTVIAQAKPAATPRPAQSGMATRMMPAVSWADIIGRWAGKSMRGASDSVVATFVMTVAPERKVSVTYPDRAPLAGRVIAAGGDSVVVEYGPYPAVTRPGHTVVLRHTLHFMGDRMRGTLHAAFDDRVTSDDRMAATREPRNR